MGINLLLAAVVAVSGPLVTVTNDTDQTVTAVVQVYDGRIQRTLEPGMSYSFGDAGGDAAGAHWAVWVDGELAGNGVFDVPLVEAITEPGPVAQVSAAPAARVVSTTPIVRLLGGRFAV
jgi:hypothetical protein